VEFIAPRVPKEKGLLMGAMATATCDCGYSRDLWLGGGMTNFETMCLFPIYCRGCRTLQQANLLDSPVLCPGCGGSDVLPYDAPELIGETGVGRVFNWNLGKRSRRVLTLSDGRYLCPACQQTQLRFKATGCWD
jgi:hypothetical protein